MPRWLLSDKGGNINRGWEKWNREVGVVMGHIKLLTWSVPGVFNKNNLAVLQSNECNKICNYVGEYMCMLLLVFMAIQRINVLTRSS